MGLGVKPRTELGLKPGSVSLYYPRKAYLLWRVISQEWNLVYPLCIFHGIYKEKANQSMPVAPDINRSISKERRGRGCWRELNTTFLRSWDSWRRNSGIPKPLLSAGSSTLLTNPCSFLGWAAPPSPHSLCSKPSLISSWLSTNLISSLRSFESIFYYIEQSGTLLGSSSSLRSIIRTDDHLHLSLPASLRLQSIDVIASTQDSPTLASVCPELVCNSCASVGVPHSLLLK